MSHRRNGRRHFVDLGVLTFEMRYGADSTMHLTVVDGGGVLPDGHTETVTTTVAEVRPHVYLTSWRERRGTRVLHLEDFERGRVHSRIALPGGEPHARLGTLTRLR
ncbi:MoaF-related domain-containing protein [Streptomyces sp. NPDC017673]|uniref:MoaF-related domain-containing protein n=1 Tax=unclassified Streptomyces TaxID=2593676 RepID=UPI00379CBD55